MRGAVLMFLGLGLAGCSRPAPVAEAVTEPPPTRAEIWAAIQPMAGRYELSPTFVYALVAAESDFDPRAQQGDARGLLQIKPQAWRAVSRVPYEPTVWQWRANLQAGVDYLAYARSYLHQKTTFSYPLLLAAFHYGLEYVEERDFDPRRMVVPPNPVYRQLWSGNLAPVAPP